ESARRVTLVLFDKTGTLTEGRPRLTDRVHVAGVSEEELLGTAAALEEASAHPLALAGGSAARERGRGPPRGEAFASRTRLRGIGRIAGSSAMVGSARLLNEEGVDSSAVREELDRFAAEAKTPLLVAADGRLLGVLAVADREKPSASSAVARLKAMG